LVLENKEGKSNRQIKKDIAPINVPDQGINVVIRNKTKKMQQGFGFRAQSHIKTK
jgi:hypothetical protein